jgi:hypothetical protein
VELIDAIYQRRIAHSIRLSDLHPKAADPRTITLAVFPLLSECAGLECQRDASWMKNENENVRPEMSGPESCNSRNPDVRAAEEAVRRLARLIGRQIARDQFRKACHRSKKVSSSTESSL